MESRPRPNWNQYFMDIAQVVKTRSPDPSKQVGCVLVSGDTHRILSTGYNGLSENVSEFLFDWSDRDTIHSIIIHAETNCLLYCENRLIYDNLILYSTLSPCLECLKLLRASGVKKIYYNEEYKNFNKVLRFSKIFEIEMIKI